jgi:hypothetical protein
MMGVDTIKNRQTNLNALRDNVFNKVFLIGLSTGFIIGLIVCYLLGIAASNLLNLFVGLVTGFFSNYIYEKWKKKGDKPYSVMTTSTDTIYFETRLPNTKTNLTAIHSVSVKTSSSSQE